MPLFSSVMAAAKLLPAERSEAGSAAVSKFGWWSSAASTCWPAMPVAPTTAAWIFITMLHAADARRARTIPDGPESLTVGRERGHKLPLSKIPRLGYNPRHESRTTAGDALGTG